MAFIDSLGVVEPDEWNRLQGAHSPFLRYEFLYGLETTGCTTAATGWAPHHWIERDEQGQLTGALPSYHKHHSFGEYVFDWAWAEAWAHYGRDYYPKLLSAVPFTPCEGPRLLLHPDAEGLNAGLRATQAILAETETGSISSWHLLFPDTASRQLLDRDQWLRRLSCEFHWHNPGFANFEAFLATLKSRKRKQIRRERRLVADQDIEFRHYHGRSGIPESALEAFHVFYQATYLKRGQRPYLNRDFFQYLADRMPEQLTLVMAVHQEHYVAAALFLHDEQRLYGRYWGCLEEYDQLHFEACYYQGIDLCIEYGLSRFDAGAQGEHKLKRGFQPELFESFHWVGDEQLRPAVADFCRREAQAIRAYTEKAAQQLPFVSSSTSPGAGSSN
ncbi:GNAT family N-acetyltransferase [Salicola sp. Rm-C-2C1-2]|uniref:GNAT family N-acetyltransferase n=1 Tax=Salicola sp. Rm-C-2C1-2 TaxID=3141321 RepID=UPI0032E51C5D